jgi:hypothetical protein
MNETVKFRHFYRTPAHTAKIAALGRLLALALLPESGLFSHHDLLR